MGFSIATIAKVAMVPLQKIFASNEVTRVDALNANFANLANNAVDKDTNQSVGGNKTFTGTTILKDGSAMASSAAPSSDAQIANKKYVDDTHPVYSGGESHVDGSGLIMKMGVISVDGSQAVVYE